MPSAGNFQHPAGSHALSARPVDAHFSHSSKFNRKKSLMWISLSDAFLSIVAIPGQPDMLKVRARRKGDIERIFPEAAVQRTPGRDYLYRAEMPRGAVSSAIAASLAAIEYDNFKNSVSDTRLHSAYASVWSSMSKLQELPPYSSGGERGLS
jgi:hypothetical protein